MREKVSFKSSAGETLSGVLEHPTSKPIGWAILAHCFTCNKNTLAESRLARSLAERRIGVLRFDFTGLGDSTGSFGDTGFSSNVDDLVDAVAWMASNGREVELLIGHSLGGAAAIVAATKSDGIRAVATLGAPSDAEHVIEQFDQQLADIEGQGAAEVDIGGRPFTITQQFLDDVRGASVREAAAALGRPLLILHAPTDEIVGIDNATDLFLAAKHPKSFVSLDQADHMLTDKSSVSFAADVIAGWAGTYFTSSETTSDDRDADGAVLVSETGTSGPYQNEVRIGNQVFLADEPEAVGGKNTGPNPYEWVAAGLGACTSITLRMYANRKSWPVEKISVRVAHARKHHEDCKSCGPNDKIDVFGRQIDITGELDEDQKKRLLEIADKCPVHRTLENTAIVETSLVT